MISYWSKTITKNQERITKNFQGKEEIRLAISRERKEELVGIYGQLLSGTNGIVVTEYKGLTVAQVGSMRDRLRDIDGKFVITKNTLFMRALREANWPVPEELLV